jgi:hypothetical protein
MTARSRSTVSSRIWMQGSRAEALKSRCVIRLPPYAGVGFCVCCDFLTDAPIPNRTDWVQ